MAPATTESYTLSLPDALPISSALRSCSLSWRFPLPFVSVCNSPATLQPARSSCWTSEGASPGATFQVVGVNSSTEPRLRRSEEHTSELQSRQYLVCRLLLEKK